ncbi:hypothetical protein PhCBS80983_g02101 [Powellomyces hirtus]|uniref:Cilia- and flagella-associated protein 47 domain-containing protein n=1 Tax=Powellomyces hirtus TaxID=109895 RepID=A0A507E7S4_9FUNG|nr:hypothetical protein PhCBS80983_g02101 [Powellomyces hirtus]
MSWSLAGGAAAKGTRATPFTSLIAVSSRSSLKAEMRDTNLAQTFYSLRVHPERIVIPDYEPGTTQKRTIKVTNLTRRVKRIAFQYPSGKQFRIANGPQGWHALAPGLDVEVEIEFCAPTVGSGDDIRASSKDGREDDPSLMQHTDKLTVVVDGDKNMTVDLEAYPAGPQLEVDHEVDFGTVAIGTKSNSNINSIASSITSAGTLVGEWLTAYVNVKNVGKRKARVKCSVRADLPIRISPSRMVLSADPDLGAIGTSIPLANSQHRPSILTSAKSLEHGVQGVIKIEFRPEVVGELAEYLNVELENDVPRSASSHRSNTTVSLRANVIEHKLAFRNYATNEVLDPGDFDFGTVYFSQLATVHTILENKGSSPMKWVITHADENKPTVPGAKIREILSLGGGSGAETNSSSSPEGDPDIYAMTVQPSEGILEPFTSVRVDFAFSPRAPSIGTGFRSSQQAAPHRTFSVPMELKIVNSSASTARVPGEDPIKIQLRGTACPVLARLSSRALEFRTIPLGERLVTELLLRNDSSVLGFAYKLEHVAQFHADPAIGVLGPLEETRVQMTFSPNQLGNFNTKMTCAIKATKRNGGHDRSKNIRVQFDPSQIFEHIPIKLVGACVSTSESIYTPFGAQGHHMFCDPRNLTRSSNYRTTANLSETTDHPTDVADWATATGHDSMSRYTSHGNSLADRQDAATAAETSAKAYSTNRQDVLHRARYTTYLRERRAQRVQNLRCRRLGNDDVSVDVGKLDVAEAMLGIDRENGLLPPEPVDCMTKVIPKKSGPARQHAGTLQARRPAATDTVDRRKLDALFEQLMDPGTKDKALSVPSTCTEPHTAAHPMPPTTAAASGYDTPLSGADLAHIYAARASIEFGKVTAHSTNSLSLNLLNATPSGQPIHITMNVVDSSDSITAVAAAAPTDVNVHPVHQIIAPMTVSRFHVHFCSHTPGQFERKITYIVNGRYKFSVPIHVDVAPVGLDLMSRAVHLEVNPSHGTITECEVVIKNPGNYEAGFQWVLSSEGKNGETRTEGRFTVQPASGVVPAKSQLKANIRYIPGIKPVDEAEMLLHVLDTNNHNTVQNLSLHCKGSTPASHCVLVAPQKQNVMNLGVLSVAYPISLGAVSLLNQLYFTIFRIAHSGGGKESVDGVKGGSTRFRIKNTSTNPAVFTASNEQQQQTALPSEAHVEPYSGIIPAMSAIDLSLECVPTSVGIVEDCALITTVGGGRVIRVPYRYEARAPDVGFDVLTGDMAKGTVIGSSSYKRLVMTNRGTVAAGVVIDLRDNEEFDVRLRDASVMSVRNPSAPGSRPRTTSGRQRRVKEVEAPAKNSHLIQALGHDHKLYDFDICQTRRPNERSGKIFLIEIPAGEVLVADISFIPAHVYKHSFDLPLYLIGSPPTDHAVPTIHIEAEGMKSPLHLSRSSIDFKNRVVHRGDHHVAHIKAASKEILTLTNQSSFQMEWWFDMDPLDGAEKVFKVEPWRSVLGAGASQTVTIIFQPENTGLFEASLPLHLDYLGSKPLLSVPLQGCGVEASLAFDPPEIFLPMTPPGVESTAVFSIINYGCERTEIRELIPDEIRGSLELAFPEGKLLKSDGEKLTIVARFLPSAEQTTPLSFTTKLQMSSDGRRAFYLPVHGTSDTSILTLQSHIWLTTDRSSERVEILTDNQKRNRILNGPRPFKTPSGIPLEHGPDLRTIDSFLTGLGETLVQWLDDHITHPMAWKAFPHELRDTGGHFLHDLVQSITGRKPQVGSVNPGSTAEDDVRAVHAQNVELLTYLTGLGALLSSVNPEFLLSLEEYKTIKQIQITQQKREMGTPIYDEHLEYKRKIENHYALISKDTWCTLLLQIMRVFVALPITLRQFRALPGVDKQEATMDWQVASKSRGGCENVLLRWVAFHAWKWTGNPQPITNLDSDFYSCTPLAYLLSAHLPRLFDSHFRHLKDADDVEDGQRMTQSAVLSALTDLFPGCTALASSMERLKENGKAAGLNAFLLLLFLFQTLPNFIPRALVEFKCKLNDHAQREIELTNSSSRALTYVPELQGFGDFTLPESASGHSILVGPKSTIKLPIEFRSRFCRPAHGTLVLRSKKLGLKCASLLVFDLKSVVEDAIPTRTIKVEGVVYATPPASTEIEVVNPFKVKARFKINLKETQSAEHEGNPPSFHAQSHEIVLEGNETGTLTITFLPFKLGTHSCLIHFIDEHVGEFAYQIFGCGHVPHPSETVSWTAKSGESLEKAFRVFAVNAAREKAVQYALGGSKAKKNRKGSVDAANGGDPFQAQRRPLKFKVEYSSNIFRGPPEITIKPSEPGRDKKHASGDYTELPIVFHPKNPGKYTGRILLTCQDTSDLRVFAISALAISEGSRATLQFSVPARQVVLQDIPIVNRTDDDWTIKALLQGTKQFTGPHNLTVHAHGTTNYTVSFAPLKAGESAAVLTLSNLQTAQKHVYNLRGTGLDPLPAGKKEITCRARERVVEKLSIRNSTEQDVEYDVTTDLPFAAGAPTIRVAAGQTANYELVIQPRRSGKYEQAVVTFTNSAEGNYIWYLLSVQVNPPPAEETIPIQTTVRQPVLLDIPLSNPLDKDITYTAHVSGEGLSGRAQIVVPAKREKIYSLSFHPMLKMKGTGNIQFFSDEVGEFWYSLTLAAKEGPPVQLPDLSCPLGKSCSHKVPLRNPLDKPVTLTVSVSNGREFQLVYPAVTTSDGSAGLPGGPMVDGRNELQITIPPRESTMVQLVFWPSSATEAVKGVVHVSSQDIGDFVFCVQGLGTVPTPFAVTSITSHLQQSTTSSITFTNPLPDSIPVTISLEPTSTSTPSEFSLVHNRQKKLVVDTLQSVTVPFVYRPVRMVGNDARIVVKMDGVAGFTWVFPLKGVPERVLGSSHTILESRSRETLEREIELTLPGFVHSSSSTLSSSEFPSEDEGDAQQSQQVPLPSTPLQVTFRIAPVATSGFLPHVSPTEEDRHLEAEAIDALTLTLEESRVDADGAVVKFKAIWTPPRPAIIPLHLFISDPSTNSTWRSTLRLISHPPSLDDTIVIEGTLNRLSCVSFTIRSTVAHDRTFRAFFTGRAEEAGRGEFAVMPREGVLVPEHKRKDGDNAFIVGYRAREYGKTTVGILVVECDDISWTFEVRGVTPASSLTRSHSPTSASSRNASARGGPSRYAATSGANASVLHHRAAANKLTRNFIRENAIKPLIARAARAGEDRGIEA